MEWYYNCFIIQLQLHYHHLYALFLWENSTLITQIISAALIESVLAILGTVCFVYVYKPASSAKAVCQTMRWYCRGVWGYNVCFSHQSSIFISLWVDKKNPATVKTSHHNLAGQKWICLSSLWWIISCINFWSCSCRLLCKMQGRHDGGNYMCLLSALQAKLLHDPLDLSILCKISP